MNNAGAMNSRLIVILNDNDMSVAPPVGAMSAYLSRLYSGKTYRSLREAAKQLGKHLPKVIADRANRAEEYSRGFMVGGGTLFEELGFYYVGPIDGHNLDHLLPVLKNVRDMEDGPILVHVVTQKGNGYGPAEASAHKYHAVVTFDVATAAAAPPTPARRTTSIRAGSPISSSSQPPTKPSWCTWSRPKSRSTPARARCAIRAAKAAASRCPKPACPLKSARAASSAKAARSRY